MIALIPAGGKAVRFNKIQKELLPIEKNRTLIENALDTAAQLGADYSIVITNHNKIAAQMRIIEQTEHRPIYLYQESEELHEALLAALPFTKGHSILLLFPDTVFDIVPGTKEHIQAAFYSHDDCIMFGAFKTNTPERYSIFSAGRIKTKPQGLPPSKHGYSAYGTVVWSAQTSKYWLSHAKNYTHYDDMFNDARSNFCDHSNGFSIDNYQDLGTWEAYKAYIQKVDSNED